MVGMICLMLLVATGTAKEVTKGVEYFRKGRVHVVKINLKSGLTVRPALAWDRIGAIEKVSSIAKRNGAVAAINGTFFCLDYLSLPIGFIVINGRVVNMTHLSNRTACGVTQDGRVFFWIPQVKGVVTIEGSHNFYIWGMNRSIKKNEVIVYSPEYGGTTRTRGTIDEIIVQKNRVVKISKGKGNNIIPKDGYVIALEGRSRRIINWVTEGKKINLKFSGLDLNGGKIIHAFTGGPRLVENGKIKVTTREEGFRGYLLSPHPRTAIGVTKNNEILMVVVDKGVTYRELAHIMLALGANEAMALDGGFSSAMWVRKGRVGRGGRSVSNAIIVVKKK